MSEITQAILDADAKTVKSHGIGFCLDCRVEVDLITSELNPRPRWIDDEGVVHDECPIEER